jgi:hypothetical protein
MSAKQEPEDANHDRTVNDSVTKHTRRQQPPSGSISSKAMPEPGYREVSSQAGKAEADDRGEHKPQMRPRHSLNRIHDAVRLFAQTEGRGCREASDDHVDEATSGEPETRQERQCGPPGSR